MFQKMSPSSSMILLLNETKNEEFGSDFVELGANSEYPLLEKYFLIAFVTFDFLSWIPTIIGEVFIIWAMLKIKKLQTRMNYYILSLAVIEIVQIVKRILFEFVFVLLFNVTSIYYSLLEYYIDCSNFLLYIVTSLVIIFDWLFTNVVPEKMTWYVTNWKKVFISLLVFCVFPFIVLLIVYIFVMDSVDDIYTHHVLEIFYWFTFLFLTGVNLCKNRYIKDQSYSYILTVCNIIIYSLAPNQFIQMLSEFFRGHHFLHMILFFLEFVAFAIQTNCPSIVVYFLIKNNKYFKIAFDKLIKRSRSSYSDEELDRDSISDKFPNEDDSDRNGNVNIENI